MNNSLKFITSESTLKKGGIVNVITAEGGLASAKVSVEKRPGGVLLVSIAAFGENLFNGNGGESKKKKPAQWSKRGEDRTSVRKSTLIDIRHIVGVLGKKEAAEKLRISEAQVAKFVRDSCPVKEYDTAFFGHVKMIRQQLS